MGSEGAGDKKQSLHEKCKLFHIGLSGIPSCGATNVTVFNFIQKFSIAPFLLHKMGVGQHKFSLVEK